MSRIAMTTFSIKGLGQKKTAFFRGGESRFKGGYGYVPYIRAISAPWTDLETFKKKQGIKEV